MWPTGRILEVNVILHFVRIDLYINLIYKSILNYVVHNIVLGKIVGGMDLLISMLYTILI